MQREERDLVRSIGADHVVDYTSEDFSRNGQRYDVVFDLVGNRSLTDCRRALTPEGTLVLSGGGVSEGGSFVGPMALFTKGHGAVTLRPSPAAASSRSSRTGRTWRP